MKSILLFFSLVVNILCVAQDSVVSGVTHPIYSTILKEERTYTISLPQSYYNKKYTPVNYPVFYVLDGEMSFDYMNSIVKFLSKGVYAHIPEMIIVAVHNTNRTRDLTPTKSSAKSPDDSTKILFEKSGGNENFTNFISKELISHIDSNYRTNTFKIIAGHSFGGLAVTNVLLHHPEMFNAYIIHDPSYWWDNEYTLKRIETNFT
ncbi:alpha/beta hydrolase [Niabella ginsengisoli]|uniref:Alpha/beta hydrolase-fold protein n=1 Tax=Niabella ginsengisoli TaxID=522298 RepID=A0ABS9SFS2_9BACT|nr:alpha/beta hydrolase-fold protein [Niabella ginsengisoli]MCH5597211.1 alpha/beta hydrolase-fold protein [Niabella ginsengisoli]